ncbi:hypothetical protein [Corallococcus macrosporus]|uniref:DUF4276 domain-containing protein n=1 Tax=Myxococcus fulvus (strain ATCC BAA-855 / HW-1) TaxID=483219 RepID=F8C7C6_MYXFH|nr:hypothetical protein [Corallococcus macrosporus]AEI63124.1 hypothetical protein LILAB_06015 [Corallococcus macrosporus]
MSEPAYVFGVVCEAPADQQTACTIADRVISAEVDWVQPEFRDTFYRWSGVGASPDVKFVRWQKVREESALLSIRPLFGRFGGEAGKPDALMTRRALLLFASLKRLPDAVVLVRDSDGDASRRDGLEQARSAYDWPFSVVIALAEPKREAWVLSGFEPKGHNEGTRLQRLKERLSVDPLIKSHELDASTHGAKTDIKRALRELTQDDQLRELQCIEDSTLDLLKQRGAKNGLADFMKEVQERLVPIFKGPAVPG